MTFEKTTALLENNETSELHIEDIIILDTLYYHIIDMTSSQIIRFISENLIDFEQIRDYIQKSVNSDYPEQKREFLKHIYKTYLEY